MSVLSPCDGEVIAAVDGIADNAIGATNREMPAGNHVVVSCQGLEILLAHFRNGTVEPETGAAVAAGDRSGLAGNSGNSSEPYLHIHAVRAGAGGFASGEPAPITFDGVFPVRGTVIRG
jgi:murein DD-endopeptidase MepM/ murein hydrolase activator NlpD